ncbi:helix-turn-helix domain-containing protein [Fontisphaera persica]|uniref:helix-turn-helix domain-containing protein n=1 Tax=Fontisphaera persica TaxID=2974023 RepID=UPI003CCCC973
MSCCTSSGGGAAAARPICYPPGVHTTYFELYRMRTHRHWLRQKLVAFAKTHGIKAAVREFGCSRNTVRKWLRRHVPGKPSSLQEHSRRPRRSPRRIPSGLEGQIVKLRHQTGFGAERLQRESPSPAATTPSPASSANTISSAHAKRNPPPKNSSAPSNGTGHSSPNSPPIPSIYRTFPITGPK